MKRIAIIGGGIAGLSAAWYLEKARQNGAELEWILFEKSDRLGGVIQTEQRAGFVLEAGPDSFLTMKPDAARLCTELGLAGELIYSNDSERKTYILVKGRLVAIPHGLEFMVPTRVWPMMMTPLFSLKTKLRMGLELFLSRRPDADDESVEAFVRRHFGREMVDRVAEPLLAGVYGGNAERLSIRAVLPRFAEMESTDGSLVRATLRAKAKAKPGTKPQPLFTSLRNGMQQMVDALVSALPRSSLRLRQAGLQVRRAVDGWQVECGGSQEKLQAVMLAMPAPAAAAALRQVPASLVEGLNRIEYTSSVAVALAYESAELPPGHGFLVPRSEGRQIMACTFVHKKFAHRAPEGTRLLRCFFSSSRMPELLRYRDEDFAAMARHELQEILGLGAPPIFTRTFRSERAMAQYETGHPDRVAAMEKTIGEMPGLFIIGNSFHGIGVPDCIRSARLAVEQITSDACQPAAV